MEEGERQRGGRVDQDHFVPQQKQKSQSIGLNWGRLLLSQNYSCIHFHSVMHDIKDGQSSLFFSARAYYFCFSFLIVAARRRMHEMGSSTVLFQSLQSIRLSADTPRSQLLSAHCTLYTTLYRLIIVCLIFKAQPESTATPHHVARGFLALNYCPHHSCPRLPVLWHRLLSGSLSRRSG